MLMTVQEWLADREKNPPQPELCQCGRPFKPRFNGGPRPKLNGKTACDECYEESIEAATAGVEPTARGPHHGYGSNLKIGD